MQRFRAAPAIRLALAIATYGSAAPALAAVPPPAVQDCMACHPMAKGAPPATAPNLWNVLGRKAGSTRFGYSKAMRAYGQVWRPENLQAFIRAPSKLVPGTAMDFPGLTDPAEARAVVRYLAALKDGGA